MKTRLRKSLAICTRTGWAAYYAQRYSRDPLNTHAEHLALWYLLLVEMENNE